MPRRKKPIKERNPFDVSNKPFLELTEFERARFDDHIGGMLEEPMFGDARSGEGKLLVVAAVLVLPTGEARLVQHADEWGDGEGSMLPEHTAHIAKSALLANETMRVDHIYVRVRPDYSCVCSVTAGEAQEHAHIDDILAPTLHIKLDNAREQTTSESTEHWLVVLTTADGDNRIVFASMEGEPRDHCGDMVRRARRLKWVKPEERLERALLRLSVSAGGWTASIKLDPVR